jgi:predicted AAA+ superfamily ATPase
VSLTGITVKARPDPISARFSFKLKDHAGHNKKIYCTDNGLAVSAGFRFSADRGALHENLAAVALKKEELAGRISLFYWKSPPNGEVDFVVKEGPRVARLIQVCSDISNPKTLNREMRPADEWVHPILVYADLLATGNQRNIETARMIYEQHIVRLVGEN